MRKVCSLIVIVFFLLPGCNDKQGVPPGIIATEKMQKIFWELIQSDVFVNDFVKRDTTKNAVQESILLQNKIFYLNHTTKDEFYRSYDFYKSNPELMKIILDSISVKADREREKQRQIKRINPL